MVQTFKSYLRESALEHQLADVIKTSKPFLNAVAQDKILPIYRGLKNHSGPITEIPHPVGRFPRDSGAWFNLLFNAGIDLALGVPNVRSGSVFATGGPSQAAMYGKLNLFIPKGNFEFIWAPEIHDSGVGMGRFLEPVYNELNDRIQSSGLDFGGDKPFATQASIRAGFTKLETKIGTDSSYFVEELSLLQFTNFLTDMNTDTWSAKAKRDAPHLLIDALKGAFKKLYQNDNLAEAVKSRNEILFCKTDGYWVINLAAISDKMNIFNPRLSSSQIDDMGLIDRAEEVLNYLVAKSQS